MEWSVEVVFKVPIDLRADESDRVDRLIEAMTALHPALSVSGQRLAIAASFDAEDSVAAYSKALSQISSALRDVGLSSFEVTGARISNSAEFEEELRQPTMPPLLGVAELADRLGVSRQRISELSRGPDFPVPVAKLAAGPVWIEGSVDRFVKNWSRRAGRRRS